MSLTIIKITKQVCDQAVKLWEYLYAHKLKEENR